MAERRHPDLDVGGPGVQGGSAARQLATDNPPSGSPACNVVITDDGPGVVMALCRRHGVIVRDSALSWGYLLAMVTAHKEPSDGT